MDSIRDKLYDIKITWSVCRHTSKPLPDKGNKYFTITITGRISEILNHEDNNYIGCTKGPSEMTRDSRFLQGWRFTSCCDSAYCCGRIPTFRRNCAASMSWSWRQHSSQKCCCPPTSLHRITLKIDTGRSPETLVSYHITHSVTLKTDAERSPDTFVYSHVTKQRHPPSRQSQEVPPKRWYPITSLNSVTLKINAGKSPETLISCHITKRCHNLEDQVLLYKLVYQKWYIMLIVYSYTTGNIQGPWQSKQHKFN